jgi:hypothetical protein
MNPYLILVPVAICALAKDIRNIRRDYLEFKKDDTLKQVINNPRSKPEINSLSQLISVLKEITPLHLFMK